MIERCARCGAPAGAAMSYNYTERVVWLDDLAQPVEPGAAYPLCVEHGDRLTPRSNIINSVRSPTTQHPDIAPGC